VLINTGNISRKVLSKVLRSFVKNFERLHLLPALGFAVTMTVIGTIGIAILGVCIALLQSNFAPMTTNVAGGDMDDDD